MIYYILGDSWLYMPPILVLSSAKRITTQILVIAKLNGRKDLVLRGYVYDVILLSKQLSVQSLKMKLKNQVWKLFKIRMKTLLLLTVNMFQTLL